MRLVALRWMPSVQEIEGINNIIQGFARRAPRISLPLLDARVGVRKYIGLGSRAARNTAWNKLLPVVHATVEECTAHYEGVSDVLANPQRWCLPQAAQPVSQPLRWISAELRPFTSAELAWAAHNNRALLATQKSMLELADGMPLIRVAATDGWLCCT